MLHRVRRLLASLVLFPSAVALSGGLVGAQAADPDVLLFAGCDANIPITRLLARTFTRTHPEVSIHFETVGSTNGIALAAAGGVHVGLVSRTLHDGEEGRGLTFRPYARTAVIIAADPNLPDIVLTTADLLALYRGTKQGWGASRKIALLTREEGDSSVVALKQTLTGFADAYAKGATTHHWTVLYDEPTMHEALLTIPSALGLSDLGTITIERLPLKALVIDGVTPTLENVARGRYPLTKTLAFVWREDILSASARGFLEFVHSPEAAAILTVHGYLPVD